MLCIIYKNIYLHIVLEVMLWIFRCHSRHSTVATTFHSELRTREIQCYSEISSLISSSRRISGLSVYLSCVLYLIRVCLILQNSVIMFFFLHECLNELKKLATGVKKLEYLVRSPKEHCEHPRGHMVCPVLTKLGQEC